MKRSFAVTLAFIGTILALPCTCDAEPRTISWGAVTTYNDNTPIGPTVTVAYNVFWTTDPALTPASLQTVVSSIAQTSRIFDPDSLGIPRGQTSYFTLETVLGTGERSALSPAYPWVAPTLSGLSISGPSSVNENGSGTYTATATWSDGSTTGVTPTWTVAPTTYASISASGLLTTLAVTANQTATVSASYTSGGVTRTATQPVTIVDVPGLTLAAPQNVGVTGPVSTPTVKLFRLKWDPVTTRADGTPIPEGSVSYDAYWTTDSTLEPVNWTVLASSTASTYVDFDPNSAGMHKNQRVYFTTRAKSTLGERSPLAPAVSWVANNQGPSSPKNPVIHKK